MTVSLFSASQCLEREELTRLNASKHMLGEENIELVALKLEVITLLFFHVSSRGKVLDPTLFQHSYKFFGNNLLRNNLWILCT